MEKILNYTFRSVALRLMVAGMIVILPVGLSTAWLGAAYQQVMWDASFTQAVLDLMLSGTPAIVLFGLTLLWSIRLGVRSYPTIVESSYCAITATNIG